MKRVDAEICFAAALSIAPTLMLLLMNVRLFTSFGSSFATAETPRYNVIGLAGSFAAYA